MNGPQPVPSGRLGQLQARLDALQAAHAQATADIARADHAAAALLTARKRPPRDLRRKVQGDRGRLTTKRAAIEADMRQIEADLAVLHARLAVVQAELAQLNQRDHPITAAMTIAQYSARVFALQRELRDLVGSEAGTTM